MKRREFWKRLRSGVAAVLVGVLVAFFGLAAPAQAEALSKGGAATLEAMGIVDPFAEELEGEFEAEGTTYRYRQFYDGELRTVELTDLETGAVQTVAYNPSTGEFLLDGTVMGSAIALSVDENSVSPMVEGDWVTQGDTTIYLSFGAAASALDIAIQICLIVGIGSVPDVYSKISDAIVNAVTAAGGCYVTYRIEMQTIGWYQNQRVVFSIRAGSSSYGPWTVYLPPRS